MSVVLFPSSSKNWTNFYKHLEMYWNRCHFNIYSYKVFLWMSGYTTTQFRISKQELLLRTYIEPTSMSISVPQAEIILTSPLPSVTLLSTHVRRCMKFVVLPHDYSGLNLTWTSSFQKYFRWKLTVIHPVLFSWQQNAN